MAKKKETNAKILERKLAKEDISGWEKVKASELSKIENFADKFKSFIKVAKTERLAVREIQKIAEKNGYVSIETLKGKRIQTGTKIFSVSREKAIILAITGNDNILKGINLIGSHLDSPRLDLKLNPLYEDANIALLKTHYYGGIKKFHWLNIPLALYGIVILKNGKKVNVAIGDSDDDPAFIIPDLLPHLSRKQREKKVRDAFEGENLNIIVGNRPINGKDIKEKVKLNILKILNDKYGIIEQDFNSAEFEVVPRTNPIYIGFDKSMLACYGQDDRICSYSAVEAIINIKKPKRTAVVVLVDKEEIGSYGNSSIQSNFIDKFFFDLFRLLKKDMSEQLMREIFYNTTAISGDVEAGVNPNYKDVHDLKNAPFIGNGVSISKYGGGGGKYHSNDANAEFVGKLRKLFNDNKVIFQFAELGKVDEGGGGTIAGHISKYGLEIVDCGTPVLGMHSPYEVSSILDLYQTYFAYKVFLEKFK